MAAISEFKASPSQGSPLVSEILTYYYPGLKKSSACPNWPPDLFGLLSVLLELSGAYLLAFRSWPPDTGRKNYADLVNELAEAWRFSINEDEFNRFVPQQIAQRWRRLVDSIWGLTLKQLAESSGPAQMCVELLSIADSTCHDLLHPLVESSNFRFDFRAVVRLFVNDKESRISSIGLRVPSERLIILPKRRTPTTGLNIRSLSLYLGAVRTGEVHPQWVADNSPSGRINDSESRNLLLIPWPKVLAPIDFMPVAAVPGDMGNIDPSFGFFTLRDRDEPQAVEQILSIYREAIRNCGSVDAIVLPEAALSEPALERFRKELTKLNNPPAVLTGVSTGAISKSCAGRNQVAFVPRFSDPLENVFVQDKHHRWQINKPQILQYNLGPALSPNATWWEYINLTQRRIHFFQVAPWLTVAPLICEDLARPDPAGELLRAFGPDLVIALLMDGPQLPNRWAARNAMILADDPGCAVLCFTSAGMVDLSNTTQPNPQRVVALYKDPSTQAKEISLPKDADAIVLTLSKTPCTEWSADGRSALPGKDYHPILSGIRYIKA
jgi:hypothetical protein